MRMYFKRLQKLCNRKKKIEKSKNLLLEEVGENDVDEDITKLNDFLIENENFFKLAKEKPLISCNLMENYENFQAVKVRLESRPFQISALKNFKGISFFVEPRECFGLLGPNGAGKTSTFKMITGEHVITAGDDFINGIDIQSYPNIAVKQFGYCPQVSLSFNI